MRTGMDGPSAWMTADRAVAASDDVARLARIAAGAPYASMVSALAAPAVVIRPRPSSSPTTSPFQPSPPAPLRRRDAPLAAPQRRIDPFLPDGASPFQPFADALGASQSACGTVELAVCSPAESSHPVFSQVLRDAGRRALGGGVPGMVAMGIQVMSLMWLRTTVNYQYRYGTTTMQALRTLYSQGGVRRFYRGVGPALIQGPLSRFGDTAANSGVLAFLDSYKSTEGLPVAVKTACASIGAGCWRIFLMPVDACKTMLQVEGKSGLQKLGSKIATGGPTVLYHGALAAWAATTVGHYPWFATYNYLNYYLPQYDDLPRKLVRSAIIGFCSSFVSDTCSNSIRVIKTTRQTATTPMTYPEVVKMVLEKEGLTGLMFRGLKTKILTNGLQGILFTVLWRLGQDMWAKRVDN